MSPAEKPECEHNFMLARNENRIVKECQKCREVRKVVKIQNEVHWPEVIKGRKIDIGCECGQQWTTHVVFISAINLKVTHTPCPGCGRHDRVVRAGKRQPEGV